jgi:hypothetical protein
MKLQLLIYIIETLKLCLFQIGETLVYYNKYIIINNLGKRVIQVTVIYSLNYDYSLINVIICYSL